MKIDMEFARRDDCLDKMVPSDLRELVGEIERLRSELAELREDKSELEDLARDYGNQLSTAQQRVEALEKWAQYVRDYGTEIADEADAALAREGWDNG